MRGLGVLLGAAIVMLASGCGKGPAYHGANTILKNEASALDAAYQRSGYWNRVCAVGSAVRRDDTVVTVDDQALHAGLRPGDRILRVDSQPVEDSTAFSDATAKHAVGDMVALSLQRGETVKTLSLECHDIDTPKRLYRDLIAALNDGDREACIGVIAQLKGQVPMSSRLGGIEFDCKFAAMDLRNIGTAGVEEACAVSRLRLDEATKDPALLDSVRPHTLEIIRRMRASGYGNFAAELEEKLARAEAETYGAPQGSNAAQNAAPKEEGKVTVSGTGFAVSSDGTIVTSAHVVAGVDAIAVYFADGSRHDARILTASSVTDIAVLKVDAAPPAWLQLAPSSTARLGDRIFTIGFPTPDVLGFSPKYSEGSLASLSGMRDEPTYMQMSIPIQPGNSGGPVVDSHGRVIGIVAASAAVAYFVKATGGNLPQNVNWAVKSEYADVLMGGIGIKPATPAPTTDITERVKQAVCQIMVSATR